MKAVDLVIVVAVLLVACSKHEDAAPKKATVAPLPAGEVQRGQDACAAYIAKVCACTSPAAQKQCTLAKANAASTGEIVT